MDRKRKGVGAAVGAAFLFVAAVVGFVSFVGPAGAAVSTLYVNKGSSSCSDSGSGTLAQPYCSITKAASVAAAGQTVLVSSGSYAGGISVAKSGTSSAPITFETAPGATVTVTGGTNGFKVSSKSWVTIKGFTITQTTGQGIYLTNSANVTVDGNTVSFAGKPTSGNTKAGITLSSTTASLIIGNTTRNNSDHGINVSSSSGNQIRNNVSFSNARQISRAAAGIFLSSSTGNTVSGNYSHDNEDSGISLWSGSNNSVVLNNVVSGNGDHGIDVLKSTGETIVANTVYRSVDSGIEMQGSAGANLVNNISVDNGINSPRTSGNIRVVDSGSASQTTMDYDLVYLSSGTVLIDYVGSKYSTLTAFQAARGKELHGKQGDPKFTAPGSDDFHLRAGSPAIDSANSGAAAQPASDRDGVARVDDPATPNTGVGPRSYDDRGAYEFVPTSNNGAPVAANDTATTPQDTAVTVTVLANDSDPDGDSLTVTGASAPGHGAAVVNANSTVGYTPTAGYSGPDSFTYTISDGRGGTDSATVSVTVTPPAADRPPVAANDTATTPQDTAVTVAVLANDSDPDGDSLTVTGAGAPAHGAAAVNANSTVRYTPAAGYSGPDSFTYTISDGRGGTDSATVSVTVTPPAADRPPVAVNDSATTGPATAVTVAVLANDSDPDGDPMTVTGASVPAHGTAVVNANSTVTYTPVAGYSGPDSFTYTISDGRGGTDSATVSVTVSASTNLVANPGFETDTAGWQAVASTTSLTRVAGGHSGGFAAQLSNSTAGAGQCGLDDKPNSILVTQSGPYTYSMWVRATTAGQSLKLRVREYQNGSQVGTTVTTNITLTTAWQQVSLVATPVAPGQSVLDFQAYTSSAPVGLCFLADDISITH